LSSVIVVLVRLLGVVVAPEGLEAADADSILGKKVGTFSTNLFSFVVIFVLLVEGYRLS